MNRIGRVGYTDMSMGDALATLLMIGSRRLAFNPAPVRSNLPARRVNLSDTRPLTRIGECARRRLQIEKGTLTLSNGLLIPGMKYLGHGMALHEESGKIVSVRS